MSIRDNLKESWKEGVERLSKAFFPLLIGLAVVCVALAAVLGVASVFFQFGGSGVEVCECVCLGGR